MTARGKPFFLQGRDGPIFCMNWLPSDAPARFGVLFVPAFGEEQNKSRRTTALLGRSLAESGGSVLVLDPTGTGDSGGEFGVATWETWLDDIRVGWAWMTGRVTGRRWLAGLRLGAMLATEFACAAPGTADGLLVIQPVTSGGKFVRQFLRVAAAQRITRAGGGPLEQPDLFALLESGNKIEVGGYGDPARIAASDRQPRPGTNAPPGCTDRVVGMRRPGTLVDRARFATRDRELAGPGYSGGNRGRRGPAILDESGDHGCSTTRRAGSCLDIVATGGNA